MGSQWSLARSLLFLWEEHPAAALSQREGFDIQSPNLVQSPVWTWVCFLFFFYHFFFLSKISHQFGSHQILLQTTRRLLIVVGYPLSTNKTAESNKSCFCSWDVCSLHPLALMYLLMDLDFSEHLTSASGLLPLASGPASLSVLYSDQSYLVVIFRGLLQSQCIFPPVLSRGILVFSLEW